jgi:hypothetical protein
MSWLPVVACQHLSADGWLRGGVDVHAIYLLPKGLTEPPPAKQLEGPPSNWISWLEVAVMLGAALGLCRRRRSPRLFRRKHLA